MVEIKNLIICEADIIKLKKLKKGTRQMVTVNGRLYRTDDALLIKDCAAADACVIYDLDDTQPWFTRPIFIDPDMTKAYIDSAKIAGTKNHIWGRMDRNKLMDGLTAVIIIGALIYGVMVGVI